VQRATGIIMACSDDGKATKYCWRVQSNLAVVGSQHRQRKTLDDLDKRETMNFG